MYKRQILDSKPINFYSMESITDFLEKIMKLGGKITQPKQEVPEVGWIVAVEDSQLLDARCSLLVVFHGFEYHILAFSQ